MNPNQSTKNSESSTINDPKCLPGSSHHQQQPPQFLNSMHIIQTNVGAATQIPQPTAYSYYQQASILNPSSYGYLPVSAAAAVSSTSSTTGVIQRPPQPASATVTPSVNDPYSIYAAQLAQYQAYQQQMHQFAATPPTATALVAPNPMIPLPQPHPITFRPALMSPIATVAAPRGMIPIVPPMQPGQMLSPIASNIRPSTSTPLKTNQSMTGNEGDKKGDHYCETCKLVCTSAESMVKHVTGIKHKKRIEYLENNQLKHRGSPKMNDSFQSTMGKAREGPTSMSIILKCTICDVSCVSIDSYRTHLHGQKHHRSIDYRRKIGDPVTGADIPEIVSKNVSKELEIQIKKLFSDPNRIKSENRNRMNVSMDESMEPISSDEEKIKVDLQDFYYCKPIGQDFIEEVLNQNGKIVCYTCTLCECRFNDMNAKNLHLKGRRHRLQYKKKVDPDLIVEFVRSDMLKIEKEQVEKQRKQEKMMQKITHTRPYFTEDLDPFHSVDKSKEFHQIFKYNQNNIQQLTSIHSQSLKGKESYTRSFSDYLLEYRHHLIQPVKNELEYIYQTAYLIEKAIRNVGRFIELNFLLPIPVPTINGVSKNLLPLEKIDEMLQNQENLFQIDQRVAEFIRVVRPGPLGKGLLLTGERKFKLIILTSTLPTESMLTLFERLVSKEIVRLSKELDDYPDEYEVHSELKLDKAKFTIDLHTIKSSVIKSEGQTNDDENIENPSKIDDKILRFDCYLTCPYIRNKSEEQLSKQSTDLLNLKKCLSLLDEIKRYRWFKEMGIKYNFFTFILRILRDLSKRIKLWSNLKLWTIEVILERILISANCYLGPASLFRHFFEFLAHGILMTRGTGLADPCEAKLVNVFDYLNAQQREDLMCSTQHLVRQVALRQLHKVLDVDANIVYDIRMNELKQAQSVSSSTSTSSTPTAQSMDNRFRFKQKSNADRLSMKSADGDHNNHRKFRQQQEQLEQQKKLLEQQQEMLRKQQEQLEELQRQQQQQQLKKSDNQPVTPIAVSTTLKRKLSNEDENTFEELDLD